jgi:hypothetical protein
MTQTDASAAEVRFRVVEERTIRGADDVAIDVLEAIDALPWIRQLCPLMPHEYAVLRESPERSWFAVDAMIRLSPTSFLAYFRGYQRPNRYWVGPDSLRYWRTRFELNRCTLDSVEMPRRVDEGATPVPNWDGPPFAPNGTGLYAREADGSWLPRFEGTDLVPCRGCRRAMASS